MIIIRSTRFLRRIIIRFTGFFGIRCGTWSGDVYGRRSSRRFGGCARAGCGHGGAAVSSADVFEIGVAEVERAAVRVVFGFFCEGVETHLFYFSFFSLVEGWLVLWLWLLFLVMYIDKYMYKVCGLMN